MLRGSCLCGRVTFRIDGKITNSRYCHCTNCRKFSGTGSAAWGVAVAEQFSSTSSEQDVRKYDTGGGGLRVFCVECGAPLWFEPNGMPAILGIPLGAIDETDDEGNDQGDVAPPEMHVWMKSHMQWDQHVSDLPQHQTIPGDVPAQ